MRIRSIRVGLGDTKPRWSDGIFQGPETIILAVAQCFPSTRLTIELAQWISTDIVSSGINWTLIGNVHAQLEKTEDPHRRRYYEIGVSHGRPFVRLLTRSGRRSIEIVGDEINIHFGPKGSTLQAAKVLKALQETNKIEAEIVWRPEDDWMLRLVSAQIGERARFNPWRNIKDALETIKS